MATEPEGSKRAVEQVEQPATPAQACAAMLAKFTEMSGKGELQGLVIGYVLTSGASSVVSTPINPMMMNHLHRLLDERVSREYRRAMQAAAEGARSPTGPVPATSGSAPSEQVAERLAQLPRKQRRQLAANLKRANKRLAKRANKANQAPTPSEG